MKLRNINTIIQREYLTRVKKKSFLVTTFLGPIFFSAICILPSLIMYFAEESDKKIAVVDESGIVMPYLTDDNSTTYVDCGTYVLDSLKNNYQDLGYDAVLSVSPIDSAARTVHVSAFSATTLSVDFKSVLEKKVEEAVEDWRLQAYDISGLKDIMEDVKADVSISTYTLKDGSEKITSSEVYMIISLVLSMIIYMFIAMFSGMVMQSVIEEKTSRVVEVLISSVKASELMFGKIIGVAFVALTQFLLWVVLTFAIVGGISSFVDMGSILNDPSQVEMMTNGMNMPEGMDPVQLAQDVQNGEMGGMEAALQTLRDLNYVEIIISFIIYFFLGYLLYASLFAAIGSAVENEADTQQLQMPVTIPLLIGFFIAFYAFKAPESQIVFWGSMIPLTSPIVMLARIPFGVPVWELALSIALLVVTFAFFAYISGKIYKIGILMYGKKTTFKDLYKWLKMK